jgi:autotransporter-associated beta strand protein
MMFGLALTLVLPVAARGQTWDGGSLSTDNWSDANNWNPNAVPANNGTATPNFAGSTRLGPVVNVNFDVNGVTFDNAAGAFTISSSGGTLTLRGGGITNNNAGTAETINAPLVLAASQSWGGAGPLNLGGTVILNTSVLTLNSPGTITLNNAVGGSGSIVKNGPGAVVFLGNNVFAGGVTLNEGILAIGLNAGLGSGALTINGGSVEGTGGSRTLANAVVINNDFAIGNGTALTFAGPITITGNHTLTNNSANLAISAAIGQDAPGRELTLSGGTLALSGSALSLGASLRLNSGTLSATGLVNGQGHTLTQNAGTFTGSLTNRGAFVYNGGAHSGNVTNDVGGDATFNANFTLTAALNNSGTLHVAGGRTLTFGTQQLNNTGTIELSGGTLSANASASFASSGVMTGFGTVSLTGTAFVNSGQINVAGGNLTLTTNVSFSNSGTITVPTGRQLQWNSATALNNAGLVELTGGSVTGTGGFGFSNNVGGEIRGGGTVQPPLTNNGGLVRAAGSQPLTISNFSGHNTGGGELRVDDGATMNVKNAFNSSGTIVLGGANASMNLVSVNNTGTMRGQGRASGAVLNSGVVRAEGGTLTFTSAGNTNTAAGRLESGAGSQLLFTQGLATNAGLIALTGGAFDNNNLAITNTGRIEGYGTVRTGGLTNNGTISVAGALDVLGPVTNNGSVTTASGAATRFFGPVDGAGSYTGAGTVVFLNTFSPGASPAAVSFGGDVELGGASTLVIELSGTSPGSQYDTLSVSGDATLGGVLDVELLGGFTPAPGSVFHIVSAAGGVGGSFSDATLPSLVGANWQLHYDSNAVLLSVALAGDYNFNGRVDAADYTLWRNALGESGIGLAADGNGDRQVNAADYAVWKTHFGEAVGSGAGGSSSSPTPIEAAVAEPASVLLSLGTLLLVIAARRHSSER